MLSLIEKALVQLQIFMGNEEGQALAQTSLVLGLVAIICLVALTAIGMVVSGNLSDFAVVVDGRAPSLSLD